MLTVRHQGFSQVQVLELPVANPQDDKKNETASRNCPFSREICARTKPRNSDYLNISRKRIIERSKVGGLLRAAVESVDGLKLRRSDEWAGRAAAWLAAYVGTYDGRPASPRVGAASSSAPQHPGALAEEQRCRAFSNRLPNCVCSLRSPTQPICIYTLRLM